MNRIGRLLALGIVVALTAGCQQSGGKAVDTKEQTSADSDPLAQALASAAAKKQGKEYTPTAPFEAKLVELRLKLSERLLTRCFRSGSRDAVNECMRDRLLAGFDTDGAAERHCTQQDIEAVFKCIMVGTLGYQLASKVGTDEAATFDWSDPENSANEAALQLVLVKLRECLGSGSASDPETCLIERLTKSAALTERDIEPCTALRDDDYQFGQCIGEASAYKHIIEGLARM
jgi:hypothetical protein